MASLGIIDTEAWNTFVEDHAQQNTTTRATSKRLLAELCDKEVEIKTIVSVYNNREYQLALHRNLERAASEREIHFLKQQLQRSKTRETVLKLALNKKNEDIQSMRQVYKEAIANKEMEIVHIMSYTAYIEAQLRDIHCNTPSPPTYQP